VEDTAKKRGVGSEARASYPQQLATLLFSRREQNAFLYLV